MFHAILLVAATLPAAEPTPSVKAKAAVAVAIAMSKAGPRDQCICGGACKKCGCEYNECLASKKLPKAPPVAYKHDCGCPGLSCNCAPLGGCHCSENRQSNRVNPAWIRYTDGNALYRGEVQLGWLDMKGVYHPLHNGEFCEPCKPPIPVPAWQPKELSAIQAAPACRT